MTSSPDPYPDPYAPHRAFVAPARDGSSLWALIGGLVIADLIFSLSPLVLFPVFGEGLYDVFEGRTPGALFLSLLLYGLPALAIVQWVRLRHGRSGWSLIGPPVTALRHYKRAAFAVLLALLAVEVLPPFPDFSMIVETRPLPAWLIALPLALVSVTVQSGAEEVIFRGYLQQQLGARSERPLVWMVGPSLLFGALHLGNAEGAAEGLLWAFWAFLLGLACADLTARTGTLGAAIGLHSANNLAIFGIYGMQDGPDSGFALFLYPFEESMPGPGLEALANPWAAYEAVVSCFFIGIMWLSARIALRR